MTPAQSTQVQAPQPKDPSLNPSPSQSPSSKTQEVPSPSQNPSPSTDEPKKRKDGLVEQGQFNHVIGVLGRPGSGKSCYATSRAVEFARQGCYVVAHDIGDRLPDMLPTGRRSGTVRHSSVDDAIKTLARDPRGIHCLSTPDASEVINLAKLIAEADMERTKQVGPSGRAMGHPVVVIIDEVVAAGICDPHKLSWEMKQLIAGRRHMNVGIIWTCQSARMVNNQLIGLSTEMVMFNLQQEMDFKKLDEAGCPPEVVAQIRALPKFQSVTHRFQ